MSLNIENNIVFNKNEQYNCQNNYTATNSSQPDSVFEGQTSNENTGIVDHGQNPKIIDRRGEKQSLFSYMAEAFGNLRRPFDWIIEEHNDKLYVTENLGNKQERTTVANLYSGSEYDVNGEIDNNFEQGKLDDCGLLSTCYSIAQTDKGKALLKDSISINYNEQGKIDSYSVYFKGIEEKYTVSKEELDNAYNQILDFMMNKQDYCYSKGDKDILLIELAWSKCFSESEKLKNMPFESDTLHPTIDTNAPKGLSNVDQQKLFYALTGNNFIENPYTSANDYLKESYRQKYDKTINLIRSADKFTISDLTDVNENIVFCDSDRNILYTINTKDTYQIEQKPSEENGGNITIRNTSTNECFTINETYLAMGIAQKYTPNDYKNIFDNGYKQAKNSDVAIFCTNKCSPVFDINGNELNLTDNHAYGIKSIDDEKITIVDPQDTTKEITILKEELYRQPQNFHFSYGNLQ